MDIKSNLTVTQQPDSKSKTTLIEVERYVSKRKARLDAWANRQQPQSRITSVDAKPKTNPKQVPPKTSRAEREFNKYLRQVGEHVGHLVNGFEAGNIEVLPRLMHMLRAYADALTPWAVSTVRHMLDEVNARDIASWRSLGKSISRQLRHDIHNTAIGPIMTKLLHEQVTLIKSLPIDAANRVHELTLKGLENSERAAAYIDEIMRSGEVTKSRATLIARTEVARTASILTQARAKQAGLTHYRWQTSKDGDVRKGHQAMQGKICRFDTPPKVNENGRIMYHHPGEIWNCRCWPEPIVDYEL